MVMVWCLPTKSTFSKMIMSSKESLTIQQHNIFEGPFCAWHDILEISCQGVNTKLLRTLILISLLQDIYIHQMGHAWGRREIRFCERAWISAIEVYSLPVAMLQITRPPSPHKSSNLKQPVCNLAEFLSNPWVLLRMQPGCWVTVRSFESLTGAEGCTLKITCMALGWRPQSWAAHNMRAGFPQSKWSERETERVHMTKRDVV